MWLLLAFLVLPIVEIALFIQMGGLIGLWPTIGLVVLSAVAGSWLMRQQGAAALADLQRAFRNLRDPTPPLAHGALILLAGALMVTPGFVTDLMGIALLIPAVRGWVIGRLGRRKAWLLPCQLVIAAVLLSNAGTDITDWIVVQWNALLDWAREVWNR